MANQPEYKCTKCGATPGRDALTVKKVMFVKMGEGGRTIRSRAVAWLCVPCIEKDEQYNLPAFVAPGVQRPLQLERISE